MIQVNIVYLADCEHYQQQLSQNYIICMQEYNETLNVTLIFQFVYMVVALVYMQNTTLLNSTK